MIHSTAFFTVRAAAAGLAALLTLTAMGCDDAQPEASLHTFTSDSAGFDTQTHYVDTGSEVVVFDSQFTPALAEQVIADIRATTDSPIRYLVITHPNPDKFNGASAFQAIGAQVVASRATAAAIPDVHAYKQYYFVNIAQSFDEASYPAEATVDMTFEGQLELELDGDVAITLEVLENPGVATTQTVAAIPALDALIVGDLVHYRAHAWLEGGIVGGAPQPDLAAWRSALDELAPHGPATVYAGRGEPAPVSEAIAEQKAYLSQVETLVAAYIADLGDRTSELLGAEAQTHHQAIAAEIIAAFPDHALPYMTEF
ncbi:MAG: MBL fold metallo-hydrolase, partial [Myxococcota bacterium]